MKHASRNSTPLVKRLWNSSFVRFALVGVINTLFGTTLMFVLYNVAHCADWLASATNYFFGSILSFFLNKYFTFHSKERSMREVARFVINIVACYLIAYVAAKPLIRLLIPLNGRLVTLTGRLLNMAPEQAQGNLLLAAGMVLFVCLNYLGQRFFTFRKPKEE